jgi:CheY-like chemotaxis protein
MQLEARRPFVRADAARLQQVFWNLIKNAIKFTPNGGRVNVRTADLGDDRIEFEVTDTGIGIAPDVLPRIFDAFEQGDASITQQFGGLGLGLAISKTLVEAHEGHIRATSGGTGCGARFVVDLANVRAAATVAADAPADSAAADAPLNILLVEDHPDTVKVISYLLAESGHHVETAASVAAALERLEHRPVDLVISDIGLPDGSGLDLMREVTERYHLRGIALSGYGSEDDVQRSLRAGFAAHLTKPVPMSTLRQTIAEVAGVG